MWRCAMFRSCRPSRRLRIRMRRRRWRCLRPWRRMRKIRWRFTCVAWPIWLGSSLRWRLRIFRLCLRIGEWHLRLEAMFIRWPRLGWLGRRGLRAIKLSAWRRTIGLLRYGQWAARLSRACQKVMSRDYPSLRCPGLLAVDGNQGNLELGQKGVGHLRVAVTDGFQLYLTDSQESYPLGCSEGEVDDTVRRDRTAVIDSDEDRLPVFWGGDANPAAEGQGSVGAGEPVHVVCLTRCGLASLKFASVPGSLSDFEPATRFDGLGFGLGVLRDVGCGGSGPQGQDERRRSNSRFHHRNTSVSHF